jgi:hypothetical protein
VATEAPKTAAPAAKPAVQYDPAVFKTAEQKALLAQGIVIPDEGTAKMVFDSQVQKQAEAKQAEQQAKVAELEARGALMLRGMTKESAAMNLVLADKFGREEQLYVAKVAGMCRCPQSEIYKLATELKKLAEMEAARGTDSWVVEGFGRGARAEDGNMIEKAEGQKALQQFESSASAGTKATVPFGSPEDKAFQDTVTIPNNPGLNHGQKTDNGKGAA